jgi:hypothetical protein
MRCPGLHPSRPGARRNGFPIRVARLAKLGGYGQRLAMGWGKRSLEHGRQTHSVRSSIPPIRLTCAIIPSHPSSRIQRRGQLLC